MGYSNYDVKCPLYGFWSGTLGYTFSSSFCKFQLCDSAHDVSFNISTHKHTHSLSNTLFHHFSVSFVRFTANQNWCINHTKRKILPLRCETVFHSCSLCSFGGGDGMKVTVEAAAAGCFSCWATAQFLMFHPPCLSTCNHTPIPLMSWPKTAWWDGSRLRKISSDSAWTWVGHSLFWFTCYTV